MLKRKNGGVAILLASLLGIFGILGIGHLYIGRIRRGIILIIVGWGIVGVSFLLLAGYSMSGLVIPPPGYPRVEPPDSALVFLVTALVLLLAFGGLWIWQILDARIACQHYNQQIGN